MSLWFSAARRAVLVCAVVAMMAALSCSGAAFTSPEAAPDTQQPTVTPQPTAPPEPPSAEPDEPDPLAGMWDPNPAFPGKRRLDGILHIDHPCVYVLGHQDWDAILIGLPRHQTDYDAASESITVLGSGPVTSGHRVAAMGSYDNRFRPSDSCPSDARFNAWQLAPSTDPFVGMYDLPEDSMGPAHYGIGILMIEPPCAFVVSSVLGTFAGDAHGDHLEPEVLALARNGFRYNPHTKSIQTGDHRPVADGDVVVIGPAIPRENRYAKICPGDRYTSGDVVIPADDAAYLSPEERQHVDLLRHEAAAMWGPTTPERPCEQLGICPTVALGAASGVSPPDAREPETMLGIVSAPLPPGLHQVWWNQTGLLLTEDEDIWVERLDRACRAAMELEEHSIVRDHDAAVALADEFIVTDGLRPDLDAEHREHVRMAAVGALWLMVTHPGVCWDNAPQEFLEAGWRNRPEPLQSPLDGVQLMTAEAQAQVTARFEQLD